MSLSRREDGEPSFWNSRRKKRNAGHIEVEELWNLKRCLVGETTSVCSVNSVSTRLSEWGLGEIKVQRDFRECSNMVGKLKPGGKGNVDSSGRCATAMLESYNL
ncbi:hypothetical protein V6N13_032848 [Hibiscus sabdariffa]